jgi:hypothetical protein
MRSGADRLARQRFRLSRGVIVFLALGAVVALIATSAAAITLRAGDIVIHADGDFAPKALPRDHDAPITIQGGGRLSTVSGELPPIIKTITIEFDRHGSLQTEGLPVCTEAKLAATTTAQARHNCPGAIIGRGFGRAVVKFPEQGPIEADSPITVFNGPRRGGNATVIGHAHLDVPAPTTFIVPVVIERIHKGTYCFRSVIAIPEIAGGAGHPISGHLKIGRRWIYRGTRHSYVNARCETGRLQARGEFNFDDGTRLSGTFLRPCTVRP